MMLKFWSLLLLLKFLHDVQAQLHQDGKLKESKSNSLPINGPTSVVMDILLENRRRTETIRLSEALALNILHDTKRRSIELTEILADRLHHLHGLFRRLPAIVSHLTRRNPDTNIRLPDISLMYFMTDIGRSREGEKRYREAETETKKSATESAEKGPDESTHQNKISQAALDIGRNYLASTWIRINETVGFMKLDLNRTENILDNLPEIVKHVIKGPYDTISEDRLYQGYSDFMKRKST